MNTHKNTVTFYTVYYTGIGNNGSTRIFTDLAKAKAFASHDYRDNPVKHTCSKPDTIARYRNWIRDQELHDRYSF